MAVQCHSLEPRLRTEPEPLLRCKHDLVAQPPRVPHHVAGLRYHLDDDLQCIGLSDGSWSRALQLGLFTQEFRLDHVALAAPHINAAGDAGSWLSFLSTSTKS